jgi:23S rRNA pseudouridine955/2504/2580 synthase
MQLEGIGEDLRSRVLYRDAELLVMDKPAGLPVQGGSSIPVSLDKLAEQELRFGIVEKPR